MKVLYMGTAEIACNALESLHASSEFKIVAVITQPDRPAGRKQKRTPCPVKNVAKKLNLDVFSPEKINAPDAIKKIQRMQADVIVVFAYGQYIPSSITDSPPYKAINIHPSLLPKYRGASPIQTALLNGDSMTGISTLYVSKEMDAGEILLQKEISILPEDNAETLQYRLAKEGACLIHKTLLGIKLGTLQAKAQNPSLVSLTRKFKKGDGLIDWNYPAEKIHNLVRAFTPWPGSVCRVSVSSEIKIIQSAVIDRSGSPGEILEASKKLIIATGNDALELQVVQAPGKQAMPAADYLRGHPLTCGSFLPLSLSWPPSNVEKCPSDG